MKHLTARQVSEWVSGERSTEGEGHVSTCERCSSEIAQMESALALFRTSIHTSASAHLSTAPAIRFREPLRQPRFQFPKVYFGLAVAIACLVLTLSVVSPWSHSVDRDAVADAKLLAQVDAALARDVPQPMEPLAVSWDGYGIEKTKP